MEAYPSDSLLGSVVDRRYRIDERVGAGAFGCVYAAWHLALGVRVALKVLTLDVDLPESERSELVARFLNEARLLTRLKHPHIVAAIDLGTATLEPGSVATPYLVMEWCEGQTLRQMLAERGALSPALAYEIMEPLADAIGHAHKAGILHRDIKPSNVMLSMVHGRCSPRLIDFGIAKHSGPRDNGASTESVTVGAPPYTAAYAAPEQVAGARSSPATDVHGLGLLFIELVTGAPPYGNSADPALAIIDATRPSADSRAGAFSGVIARAVALKASDRYADGRAFRDALREAARRELGDAHAIPSARLARRRRRPGALALGSVALLSLIALTMLVLHRSQSSPPPDEALPAALAPVTFCELSEAEQRDRLASTGLATFGFAPGWALVGREGDRIVTIEWNSNESPKDRLIAAASDLSGIDWLGVAYAVDRGCAVYARGPKPEIRPRLDAVLAGEPESLRGDTIGGPDPLAITQPKPIRQERAPAASLRELSPEEYVERTRSAGMLVHDASRRLQKRGDWYQLSIKHGETHGRLEYISGPYARAQLLAKLGKADEVIYYAIDEPVAILARGFSDPQLLERLLRDLGASVEKSPP